MSVTVNHERRYVRPRSLAVVLKEEDEADCGPSPIKISIAHFAWPFLPLTLAQMEESTLKPCVGSAFPVRCINREGSVVKMLQRVETGSAGCRWRAA